MDVAQYILCFVARYLNISCRKHTITTFISLVHLKRTYLTKSTVCTLCVFARFYDLVHVPVVPHSIRVLGCISTF